VLRLACVCECVSVCVRSGGWPGSLSFLEQRNEALSSASRANNRVFGGPIPALRLHEEDPEPCELQTT
jgi:hypothetical protein